MLCINANMYFKYAHKEEQWKFFYSTFIFPPLAVAQDSFGVDGFLDYCSIKAVKYFICDEVCSGVLAGRFSAC
jgi:hypothetical protein